MDRVVSTITGKELTVTDFLREAGELRARIAALEAENADLRHDIERHVGIASDLANEKAAAVLAETERCARICAEVAKEWGSIASGNECEARIRARADKRPNHEGIYGGKWAALDAATDKESEDLNGPRQDCERMLRATEDKEPSNG